MLRPGDQDGEQATTPSAQETGQPAGPAGALATHLAGLSPTDNLIWQRHPAGRLPAPALERLRRHQQRLRALAEAIDWGTWAAWAAGEGNPPPDSTGAIPPDTETRLGDAGGSGAVASADPASALLAELETCVLLSPVRQGAWGVEAVHRQLLGEAAGRAIQHWPLGTPVLCQRNLGEEGLANGDIGVLVERQGERLVLFPGPFPAQAGAAPGSDSPSGRLFHPARLGSAEPALALTIHKSQGSQYQEVVLLIPQSRHWDPRLLYTGLTRARQRAWLITTNAPTWLAGG